MIYSYLIVASSVISLILFILLFKYAKSRTGQTLMGIALLSLGVEWSRLLVMFSKSLEQAVWWHSYINLNLYVFFVPAAFSFMYFFVQEFRRRKTEWLAIILVSFLIFSFGLTNRFHHLFVRSVTMERIDGFWICVGWEPGIVFVFSWFFAMIVGGRIVWQLAGWTKNRSRRMKVRGFLALGSILTTAISASLDFFTFSRKPGFIFIPIIMGGISLVIIIGIWFFNTLDISPLAHETVLRRMSEGVIVTDLVNEVVNINSPAAEFVGRTKNELIGQDIFSFIPSPKGEEREKAFKEGDFHEKIILNNGGDERLFDILATNIYVGDKRVVAKLIILRDMTEFQDARRALFESETRYRVLAENIIDVIWMFDTNTGRFHYFSPSVEHLRGYTAEEALAQSMDELFTPETFERLDAVFPTRVENFLNGGDGYYVDLVEQPCKDGSTVWVEAVMQFVKNEENGHVEVYGVSRDISERLEFQKQERELAALEERQRLARDLHDAVSQTLFSARLTADVLLQQKEKIKPEILWKNIEHFSSLVKSALGEMRILLLELRPESLENTELSSLLSHLVDASSAQTETKIIFQKNVEKGLPVEVKIALYRIAQESINNAIKHAYSKQIRVQITSTEEISQLIVEDDGRGFSDTEKAGGQLGITIMRERAADVGAILDVEKRYGKGTRITCTWKAQGENDA